MSQMDAWIGEAANKALIEGEILLPVNREDISYILAEDVDIHLEDTMASGDQILMKGSAVFSIIYVDMNGKTDAFSASAPFSHTLDAQNLKEDMTYDIRFQVEKVSADLIEPRKIRGSAEVNMEADIYEKREWTPPQTEGLELSKQQVTLPCTEGKAKSSFSLQEDLRVPQGMPPIEKIIDVSAYARVNQVSKDGDKVVLAGEIQIATVYTAEDTIPIWQMNHTIPFEQMVETGVDCTPLQPVASVAVKRVSTSLREPSLFTLECSLQGDVQLIRTQEVEVAKDAYSTEETISCAYEEWAVRLPAGKDNVKYTLREHVAIDQSDLGRPLTVFCLPVVKSCYAADGSAAFEGELQCTFFYLDGEEKLRSMRRALPFEGELDVPAAKERMGISVKAFVEQQSVTGAGSELELRVALELTLCLYEEQSVRLIESVERLGGQEGRRSTFMLYFPDEEETRWDIGKQFAIPADQILECGVEDRYILMNPLI